jgi:hypothetical protein
MIKFIALVRAISLVHKNNVPVLIIYANPRHHEQVIKMKYLQVEIDARHQNPLLSYVIYRICNSSAAICDLPLKSI